MNENELRIGNHVSDIIDLENFLTVVRIDDGIITCGNEDFKHTYLSEQLKPIPLTPEVLRGCGFIHEIVNDDNGLDGDSIYKKGKIVFMHTEHDWYWDNDFPAIKYLHQLQNLFYSLVGEELEVKLQ